MYIASLSADPIPSFSVLHDEEQAYVEKIREPGDEASNIHKHLTHTYCIACLCEAAQILSAWSIRYQYYVTYMYYQLN